MSPEKEDFHFTIMRFYVVAGEVGHKTTNLMREAIVRMLEINNGVKNG